MLSFESEGLDTSKDVLRLAAEDIFVAALHGAIRLSPHIYNDEEDMDRLVACFSRSD